MLIQIKYHIFSFMHKYHGEIYLEINAYIFPRGITLPTRRYPRKTVARSKSLHGKANPRPNENTRRSRKHLCGEENASTGFCMVKWDEAKREISSCERMDSTATDGDSDSNECAQPVHTRRRRASRQTAWQLTDLFIRIPVRLNSTRDDSC